MSLLVAFDLHGLDMNELTGKDSTHDTIFRGDSEQQCRQPHWQYKNSRVRWQLEKLA
jgi:hypothetical protein